MYFAKAVYAFDWCKKAPGRTNSWNVSSPLRPCSLFSAEDFDWVFKLNLLESFCDDGDSLFLGSDAELRKIFTSSSCSSPELKFVFDRRCRAAKRLEWAQPRSYQISSSEYHRLALYLQQRSCEVWVSFKTLFFFLVAKHCSSFGPLKYGRWLIPSLTHHEILLFDFFSF